MNYKSTCYLANNLYLTIDQNNLPQSSSPTSVLFFVFVFLNCLSYYESSERQADAKKIIIIIKKKYIYNIIKMIL